MTNAPASDKTVVLAFSGGLGTIAGLHILKLEQNYRSCGTVLKAANALIGTRVDDAALDALDTAARAACKPIDDKRGTIEYRTKVAGVLAKRAAKIAFERAGGK